MKEDLLGPQPESVMQAGGYQGVLASQSSALTTLQPTNGLLMHCVPRAFEALDQ